MLRHSLRQFGFTLLELLVTLAIIAVVAGLALPALQGLLGGTGMSAASNQLAYSLQSARSEAIKRIVPVGLCPSAAPLAANPVCGGSYTNGWIVYADVDGNGTRSTADELIEQREPLSALFSVTADQPLDKGILFGISGASVNSTGVPLGGNLTITNRSTDETTVVRVASSGRVSTPAAKPARDTNKAASSAQESM